MRKPMLAANWKMNGSLALLEEFAKHDWQTNKVDIVWGLPSVYLQKANTLGMKELAGQDVSAYASGAHTGEISATMLKEIGCTYAIIGHSERRSDHREDEALLIGKWQQIKAQGINPIYCIGESLQEYESEQTDAAIMRQLEPIMTASLLDAQSVIAYEPVWAIGTGNTATPEYAQKVHQKIRNILNEKYDTIAPSIRILYGGSVKANNAGDLYQCNDIDGFLVGGASLECDSFQGILKAFL